MEAENSAQTRLPHAQLHLIDPPAPASLAHGYARARAVDGVTLVEFHGEIDLAAVPEIASLLDAATEGKQPQVLVDLTAVTFIDCSGFGQIARAWQRALRHGGGLELVCTNRRILRVLSVVGLTPTIPLATLPGNASCAAQAPGAPDGR
ncbi:STAS domain-containing protein [Streptacidiphilus sp. PB12-B1b]|uniref:STAS domain-containing protein n=1 Tax=Streptacidiphilus sp. PB12-B1b TaxID=2705012 RepID=UPI0015F8BED2|nr:STAS domain-containing protein [Streptacidiphilus sp. PB12-B1b]QMU77203.1 STAS domain-containing protein [Streptacidiphilus sp. PB12-B1b]